MPKPLLVGLADNVAGSEALHLSSFGSGGQRLWQMINAVSDMSQSEYLVKFARTNLDETYFPHMFMYSRVILPLGRVVWGQFRLPMKSPPLEWIYRDGKNFALVPNPTSRNLWYKDPENRRRVGEFLSALAN